MFETRVVGTDEAYRDDTERMAVNRFCELLGHDTTQTRPMFPRSTVIVCRDLDTGRELVRYVVGYE